MRWLLRLRARRGRAPRARRSFSARFFLRKKNFFLIKQKNAVPVRWLLRLRAAAARPKGAPLVFRSFFVFVFSFFLFKKGKTKKEKAVPMRWLLRLRAAAARAKSAPLVFRSFFCLLKKLCFSFLLSLFFFFLFF